MVSSMIEGRFATSSLARLVVTLVQSSLYLQHPRGVGVWRHAWIELVEKLSGEHAANVVVFVIT